MDTNWGAASFIRPDEQTILHADIDSRNAGWVYPADVGLIGDARATLDVLTDALRERAGSGSSGGDDSTGATSWALERAREASTDFSVPACDSDAVPIKPQRAVAAIESAADAETIVTADSGNNRFWLLNYFQTAARRTYFGSGGVGGMGWAAPAAVAAAIATDRQAVAVAGDGGFTMTMTAVETAVQQGTAPLFVVLNDTSLGMVRQMDDKLPGTEFHDTDFVGVAEAMGARGVRVTDPENLKPALAEGMTADDPTVVDVRIDRDEPMADQLASSFYDEVGGLHE